jgi:catechol 1,2-dioxygenase
MIVKPGFKTQSLQVCASDVPNLETDVPFAVTRKLVGRFVRHDDRSAPDGSGPWYSLDDEYTLEPGESRRPKPPITGKTGGERPRVEILGWR